MWESACLLLGAFFDLFIQTSVASIQIESSCLRCCERHLENLCKVTIYKSPFISGRNVVCLRITRITNFFLWFDPLNGDVSVLKWALLSPGQEAAVQSGGCISLLCFVLKDTDLGKKRLILYPVCAFPIAVPHTEKKKSSWGERTSRNHGSCVLDLSQQGLVATNQQVGASTWHLCAASASVCHLTWLLLTSQYRHLTEL